MQEFLNRVIHGDCSEIMSHMPDECVNLTVTSPPYDDLRNYNGYSFPFEEIAKQLYRVTKQGGIVVWVVGDKTEKGSETLTSFKQAIYFKEIGFNLHDTMIYQKPNPFGTSGKGSKRYRQGFEYMFVLSKGKPNTFNPLTEPCKDAGRKPKPTTRKNRQSDGLPFDAIRKLDVTVNEEKLKTNVWSIDSGYMRTTKDKFAYAHPAMYPERLAEDHILSWSNEGDTVFDCFCGSGTTLKMAYLNNRNYIGIDCSLEYVELSRKRLKV
jgi:site-specific DNA-methyltransferase (adenine-specific)